MQTIAVALIAVLSTAAASTATADPTYSVMNAAGGIYWRSAPDWNTPEAISGFGVYNGTIIAVHCYQSGTSVPGSADTMWEQATDVAGPGYGSGWLNEHFINDGQPINQPSPGVLPCNAPPPPPPPPPAGLVFTVFNAEGGIYYRYGPHWNETTATPGVGVYNGDQVELICGAFGDPVGPYNDTAWSYVNNLSRPVGKGWVNEHFVNDGATDNAFVSGEQMCNPGAGGSSGGVGSGSSGGGAPPSPTPGGSLYYSPYRSSDPGHGADILLKTWGGLKKDWFFAPAPSTFTANYDEWHPSSKDSVCPSDTKSVPTRIPNGAINGREITTLAAWSKARSAPLLFLHASPAWASQIKYILLIDPGNKEQYENSACNKVYPTLYQVLATWLAAKSTNRLAVLAGEVTADYANPVNGHGHAGIQNWLFPPIRNYHNSQGQNIRKQVVVCNYDHINHEHMWLDFKNAMNASPITVSNCPKASKGERVVSWNP
jgi:hypothetical protein